VLLCSHVFIQLRSDRASALKQENQQHSPEEIYEPGGLITQRLVPQGTSMAPALISFTADRRLNGDKCCAASNFKDHRSRLLLSGARRRETHVWGHMARRDRGSRGRCVHRCTVTGQTCPSARGRVAGEEMQTATVAFLPPPLPVGSPYILHEFYRITESQNDRDRKGPLWVIWSNPAAEAGSPTVGCRGPCLGGS